MFCDVPLLQTCKIVKWWMLLKVVNVASRYSANVTVIYVSLPGVIDASERLI